MMKQELLPDLTDGPWAGWWLKQIHSPRMGKVWGEEKNLLSGLLIVLCYLDSISSQLLMHPGPDSKQWHCSSEVHEVHPALVLRDVQEWESHQICGHGHPWGPESQCRWARERLTAFSLGCKEWGCPADLGCSGAGRWFWESQPCEEQLREMGGLSLGKKKEDFRAEF